MSTANTIAGSCAATSSVAGVSSPAGFALTQTPPATGVFGIGTVPYIIGGSATSDNAWVGPARAKNDGRTGLAVSAKLDGVSISKACTAVILVGYAGNGSFTLASTSMLPSIVTAGSVNDAIAPGGGNDTRAAGQRS
jgi:hypothetical protein